MGQSKHRVDTIWFDIKFFLWVISSNVSAA